jgi:Ca-activated chloride channel family protein
MSDFHLLRPFWLLSLVPALALWWVLWRRQDRVAAWASIIDPHLLEHLLVGPRHQRRVRPIQVLLVTWVLAAVALAGPTWRQEPSPFADDEAGLVVLLKVSGTMNATDVQPSRLARAKHKLRDLLERREGASTGLIVYSGSAHLVMPPTRDSRIISAMAEDLTPELMPIDGDALAEALELAAEMLQRAGVPGSALVIADVVAPSQVQAVSALELELPVQFLAVQPPSAPVDDGLERAAAALDASVVKLTVDQADAEQMARRARSEFKVAAETSGGQRWRDAGYAVLPLLALCTLMWSRKGWVVR